MFKTIAKHNKIAPITIAMSAILKIAKFINFKYIKSRTPSNIIRSITLEIVPPKIKARLIFSNLNLKIFFEIISHTMHTDAIKDVVINVDVENESVFIRPLKGIFDEEVNGDKDED